MELCHDCPRIVCDMVSVELEKLPGHTHVQ